MITTIFILTLLASCQGTRRYDIVENNTDEYDNVQTVTVQGQRMIYTSFDDMFFTSSFIAEEFPGFGMVIARAEILDERVEMIDIMVATREHLNNPYLESRYMPHTINRIKILEVFFTEMGVRNKIEVGNIIDLERIGGRYGDVEYIFTRAPISIGDDLIMFLMAGNSSGSVSLLSSVEGVYRVPPALTEHQTIMDITHTRAIPNDLMLQNLHPENDLTLTIGDLVSFAEGDAPYSTPLPVNIAD